MFKRSLFALAAVCGMALSAAAAWLDHTRYAIVDRVSRAWAGVCEFAAKVISGPVDLRKASELKPQKQVTASQQYVLRLMKRERPVITGDWRMCPSI